MQPFAKGTTVMVSVTGASPELLDVKELILDTLRGAYNYKLFLQLSSDDKRVFQRFSKSLKLNLNTENQDDEMFEKRYQTLLGEYQAGNDSIELKTELKTYILEGLKMNKISRNQFNQVMIQMSL